MGVRDRLSRLLSSPLTHVIEQEVRLTVDEALTHRHFVRATELAELRDEVEALRNASAGDTEKRLARVEKKLDMTMGALQAATAQLMALKSAVADARNAAHQAQQAATSAAATAESAIDGVEAAEGRLSGLEAAAPAKRKPAKKKAAAKRKAPAKKKVSGRKPAADRK